MATGQHSTTSREGYVRGPSRAGMRLVGAAALLLAVVACSNSEPSFSVGDCVKIEQGAIDSDLTGADCESAQGTFDPNDRTYRVDSVIDNTDGGCPQLQGFFPVEFVHQPDGVTYCLVQQD